MLQRRTYGLLAAVLAVALFFAFSYRGAPSLSDGMTSYTAGTTQLSGSWKERVERLDTRLDSTDAGPLSEAWQEVSQSLATELPEADLDQLESTWLTRFDKVITTLERDQSPPSSATSRKQDASQLDLALKRELERLNSETAADTSAATTEAKQAVRRDRAVELRKATLAVHDAQDQVERLKVQIEREGRSNRLASQKAQRAAALAKVMPEVRSLLAPFITPGYVQPARGRGSYNLETTTEKKPVSLERLKLVGALDDTSKGHFYLLRFGGGRNTSGNRRPLGSFPNYLGGDISVNVQSVPRVKRAQALLREHGEALVEAQLLSP
ncbi:MAG: hypothetical protein KDA61_02010 [Planctomycetales bacterium]|nr:hypothetical protein [Planctomycetales bacterium]